jgi:DNA-binding response OmpR family regulator
MKSTVLIIDDETKLAGLMARIIGLEGYHTLLAGSGKGRITTIRTREYPGGAQ